MDSVSICNLALNMLGINSITSFEEKTATAQLCREFFPVLRNRVLRDHDWSFAAKAVKLVQTADISSIDREKPFVCTVPGDCLAMRYILEDLPFRPWGRFVMVPALPATLVYTARIEDATLFDDTFSAALQYLLAAEIGMSHTRDMQLINMYEQKYQRTLQLARSFDSRENSDYYQHRRRSRWISEPDNDSIRASCGQSVNWVQGTEGVQK